MRMRNPGTDQGTSPHADKRRGGGGDGGAASGAEHRSTETSSAGAWLALSVRLLRDRPQPTPAPVAAESTSTMRPLSRASFMATWGRDGQAAPTGRRDLSGTPLAHGIGESPWRRPVRRRPNGTAGNWPTRPRLPSPRRGVARSSVGHVTDRWRELSLTWRRTLTLTAAGTLPEEMRLFLTRYGQVCYGRVFPVSGAECHPFLYRGSPTQPWRHCDARPFG